MDWDEKYRKGEVFWNKGAPSPPMRQYLERQPVRGRTFVPGCGHGHEVALAVERGLDAIGLDIAPTAIAEARALYPQLAERFVAPLRHQLEQAGVVVDLAPQPVGEPSRGGLAD